MHIEESFIGVSGVICAYSASFSTRDASLLIYFFKPHSTEARQCHQKGPELFGEETVQCDKYWEKEPRGQLWTRSPFTKINGEVNSDPLSCQQSSRGGHWGCGWQGSLSIHCVYKNRCGPSLFLNTRFVFHTRLWTDQLTLILKFILLLRDLFLGLLVCFTVVKCPFLHVPSNIWGSGNRFDWPSVWLCCFSTVFCTEMNST